ncbi:MAG: CBS domain-containing protein [Candidatus Promineifilaceae bacterium]|jgi:CBS domain-containing protein
MNVSRILAAKPKNLVTISPGQTIRDALSLLAQFDIGALVVTNEADELVGILSERDIVRRAVVEDDIMLLYVGDVMTKNVVVGVPQDELINVAHTMTERRFRHLPIVEGKHVLGIVSIGDVLKIQRDAYRGQIDTLETQIMADNH